MNAFSNSDVRHPTPVPFNRPFTTGAEAAAIQEGIEQGDLSADGMFSRRCAEWLERLTGSTCLLTPSCTAALEEAAMLIEVGPGDEVIMPSYTFSSTANAFVLRGATPVFVDIRRDTLNLDESLIADAVTPATRAIVPVHYGGVACEMDRVIEIANHHELRVIEDAAQGILAERGDKPLGSEGDLGAISFHDTKDLTCGEGGALLVNDPDLVERAEILQDKGTDRQRFFRGSVDKYSWVDIGSSYGMSNLNAAFLWAQFEAAERICGMRMKIWERYHQAFRELEESGLVRRPVVPPRCRHNAHLYYLLLPDAASRDSFLRAMGERGIQAVFHYVPLHSALAGRRYGRAHGELPVTDDVSGRIVRLPLWAGMDKEVDRVIQAAREVLSGSGVTAS